MKIELKNTTIEDTDDNLVKDENGAVSCGCGNSILKLVCHADGIVFYQNSYVCTNCGNKIKTICERTADEIWD